MKHGYSPDDPLGANAITTDTTDTTGTTGTTGTTDTTHEAPPSRSPYTPGKRASNASQTSRPPHALRNRSGVRGRFTGTRRSGGMEFCVTQRDHDEPEGDNPKLGGGVVSPDNVATPGRERGILVREDTRDALMGGGAAADGGGAHGGVIGEGYGKYSAPPGAGRPTSIAIIERAKKPHKIIDPIYECPTGPHYLLEKEIQYTPDNRPQCPEPGHSGTALTRYSVVGYFYECPIGPHRMKFDDIHDWSGNPPQGHCPDPAHAGATLTQGALLAP